jgi:hypothetical protein
LVMGAWAQSRAAEAAAKAKSFIAEVPIIV